MTASSQVCILNRYLPQKTGYTDVRQYLHPNTLCIKLYIELRDIFGMFQHIESLHTQTNS